MAKHSGVWLVLLLGGILTFVSVRLAPAIVVYSVEAALNSYDLGGDILGMLPESLRLWRRTRIDDQTLSFPSPVLEVTHRARKFPRRSPAPVAITIPQPTVSIDIGAQDAAFRVTERDRVNLSVTDTGSYGVGQQPPTLDYTAQLSCLACTSIPPGEEHRTGVKTLDWQWVIAANSHGTANVNVRLVDNISHKTETRDLEFTVLDEYGFNAREHTWAQVVMGCLGAVATAVMGAYINNKMGEKKGP